MEIIDSDFCSSFTTKEENSENASDSKGRFATFKLLGTLDFSCSEAASSSVTTGFGILRLTSEDQLEIYGSFTVEDTLLACTFIYDSNYEIASQSCSDSSGTEVTLEEESSCTLTTELSPEPPEFIKGHHGLSEETSYHYSCVFPQPSQNSSLTVDQIKADPDLFLKSDCEEFKQTGFNLATMTITYRVDPETGIATETLNGNEIHNAIELLHSEGINVNLAPEYIVSSSEGESDDSAGAFKDLIENPQTSTNYLAALENNAFDLARAAEYYDVFSFEPCFECDKALGDDYEEASQWGQEHITEIKALYSGQVAWIASSPSMPEGTIDLTDFNIFGFNTSPLSNQSYDSYINQIDTGITRMNTYCTQYPEVECLITSIGFWGDNIGQSTIWFGDDARYLEAFDYLFDVTDNNNYPGIIIFDGTTNRNELAIGEDPSTLELIEEYFGSH